MKAVQYAEMPFEELCPKFFSEMDELTQKRGNSDLAFLGVVREFERKWEAVARRKELPENYKIFHVIFAVCGNNSFTRYLKLVESATAVKSKSEKENFRANRAGYRKPIK